MLRLTLRSGRDGRFLARVIDRNGGAFVLDYGDPTTIDDVAGRVRRGGFQALVRGRWQTATPQSPDLMLMLAHYYAHKGMLVFLDEPSFVGRDETVEERLPVPRVRGTSTDEQTELLSIEHAERRDRGGQITSLALEPVPLPDVDEADLPTEIVSRAGRR